MSSIRFRLATFSFFAVLPMLALIWIGAESERQRTLLAARAELLATARIAAEQQDNVIQEAENLLRVLVKVPAVTGPSASDCHDFLQIVADDHPRIEVLTITDFTGLVFCNSRDEKPTYSVADRGYFKELMVRSPPTFAISRLIWGRGANRPVIVVAVPLAQTTPDELPIGVAIASLNLDWFSRLSRMKQIDSSRSILIIDKESGSILATESGTATTGRKIVPELAKAIRTSPSGGVVDASNHEGGSDVFGFAELPGTRGHVVVAVGLASDAILSGADQQLRRGLALGLAVALVTALFAYGMAHFWLLRPIEKILTAIREVGRGNRPDRIASDRIPVMELRVLATTINAMVDEVEARDEDLRGMHFALAASEEHHRELAENVSDMISKLSPDFIRTYVSPASRHLLGYEPHELIGQAARVIVHVDDWPLVDATLNAPLRSGADESCATYRAIHKDGSEIWLESSSRRLLDGSGFVVVTRDISERKRFETALEEANGRLEVHARQDALTGLANRRMFDEALVVELERSRRDRTNLGLLLADIDFFKSYNDTLGHQAGDGCLRLVASALASVQCRPGDVVARYGGEEFAMILPNTDLAGVAEVGERVVQAIRRLREPHPTSPASIITISVGVASSELLSFEASCPVGLVRIADSALYQAKRDGRNTVRLSDHPVFP